MHEISERVTEHEAMELCVRRIAMADGRYMLFFTFEGPTEELDTDRTDSDV